MKLALMTGGLLVVSCQLVSGQPASEIVARIVARSGVTPAANTVDTFKSGDPETRVTGIAVTMMATLDVLKRAVEKGDNLIITHEPTFYNHRDTTGALESENDSVLAAKRRFIQEHRLVIWRFHDIPHAMKPDMINTGMLRSLGWQGYADSGSTQMFRIPSTRLKALAESVSDKLGARAVRVSGNPQARVSRVVMTQGFWGFPMNRRLIQKFKPDVVIIGEDHEWETIEYVIDGISAGRIKGLVVLGHIPSEQAGMEEFARWLRPLVPGVRVDFVPTDDFFRSVSISGFPVRFISRAQPEKRYEVRVPLITPTE